MNWQDFITGIYAVKPEQPGIAGQPKFYPGVSAQEIADAEVCLNIRFPLSLRSLLLESNGVMGEMAIDGREWFDEHWLLWTLARVVEQNLWYRSDAGKECYKRDFSKVVFFADAGSDGILFGFPVNEDQICESTVVVWHPIEEELENIASSLEDFTRKWLTSSIWV